MYSPLTYQFRRRFREAVHFPCPRGALAEYRDRVLLAHTAFIFRVPPPLRRRFFRGSKKTRFASPTD
jgi:hypothetical protein